MWIESLASDSPENKKGGIFDLFVYLYNCFDVGEKSLGFDTLAVITKAGYFGF